MGREVRKVPANWKHPKNGRGHYQPMFQESYEEALRDYNQNPEDYDYQEPDSRHYNAYYNASEATHYQVYETVSEGTPVSPVFATREELARYLSEYGDFWHQKSLAKGWASHKPTYEQALAFVNSGFSVSAIVTSQGVKTPYEQH